MFLNWFFSTSTHPPLPLLSQFRWFLADHIPGRVGWDDSPPTTATIASTNSDERRRRRLCRDKIDRGRGQHFPYGFFFVQGNWAAVCLKLGQLLISDVLTKCTPLTVVLTMRFCGGMVLCENRIWPGTRVSAEYIPLEFKPSSCYSEVNSVTPASPIPMIECCREVILPKALAVLWSLAIHRIELPTNRCLMRFHPLFILCIVTKSIRFGLLGSKFSLSKSWPLLWIAHSCASIDDWH